MRPGRLGAPRRRGRRLWARPGGRKPYAGSTAQPVKLQVRKARTSTYNALRTVNTSRTGDLKAMATASVDGYWRWNSASASTTGQAASPPRSVSCAIAQILLE